MGPLYIPVSINSLRKILCTGSIIPASSNGIWDEEVVNNPYQEPRILTAYSKIPISATSENKDGDFLTILEINPHNPYASNFTLQYSKDNVDVYKSTAGIFFTPRSAHIILYNEEKLAAVKGVVEITREAKGAYDYRYEGIRNRPTFQWGPQFSPCKENPENEGKRTSYPSDDIVKDKLRGAYIAYIAGLKEPDNVDLAELIRLEGVLRNFLSPIRNNDRIYFEGKLSSEFSELVINFDKCYSSFELVKTNKRKILDYISHKAEAWLSGFPKLEREERLESAYDLLNELGTLNDICDKIGISLPLSFNMYHGSPVQMLADVEKSVILLEQSLKKQCPERVKKNLFPSLNYELIEKDSNGSVQDHIFTHYINRLVHSRNRDFTKIGAANVLKDVVGDKYSNNEIAAYLEGLCMQIQGRLTFNSPSFNIQALSKYPVIQAIATFILYGIGNDIDVLTREMRRHGVTNFHYAWCVYGAAYGYGALPRDFICKYILPEEEQDVMASLFEVSDSIRPTVMHKPRAASPEPTLFDFEEDLPDITGTELTFRTNNSLNNRKLQDELLRIIKEEAPKKKPEDFIDYYSRCVSSLNDSSHEVLLKSLEEINPRFSKTNWIKVKKRIVELFDDLPDTQ